MDFDVDLKNISLIDFSLETQGILRGAIFSLGIVSDLILTGGFIPLTSVITTFLVGKSLHKTVNQKQTLIQVQKMLNALLTQLDNIEHLAAKELLDNLKELAPDLAITPLVSGYLNTKLSSNYCLAVSNFEEAALKFKETFLIYKHNLISGKGLCNLLAASYLEKMYYDKEYENRLLSEAEHSFNTAIKKLLNKKNPLPETLMLKLFAAKNGEMKLIKSAIANAMFSNFAKKQRENYFAQTLPAKL